MAAGRWRLHAAACCAPGCGYLPRSDLAGPLAAWQHLHVCLHAYLPTLAVWRTRRLVLPHRTTPKHFTRFPHTCLCHQEELHHARKRLPCTTLRLHLGSVAVCNTRAGAGVGWALTEAWRRHAGFTHLPTTPPARTRAPCTHCTRTNALCRTRCSAPRTTALAPAAPATLRARTPTLPRLHSPRLSHLAAHLPHSPDGRERTGQVLLPLLPPYSKRFFHAGVDLRFSGWLRCR